MMRLNRDYEQLRAEHLATLPHNYEDMTVYFDHEWISWSDVGEAYDTLLVSHLVRSVPRHGDVERFRSLHLNDL